MTEATTDLAVESAGEPTAPLVNADGVLRDGWRDGLPEDIRGEKVFDRVSDFHGIMKSLASAERMVGKDKVAIPGESSTDAEWEAYHKAGGRPETPQDYNLSIPADMPEGLYTKDRLAGAQELFHKIGLSKKQVDAIFEHDKNEAMAVLQAQEQAKELARTETLDQLYGEWGKATQQRIHWGNCAVEKGAAGNEEFKARLCKKYGDDADFIRFISNLGAEFVERGSIQAANIPTPGDIQAQIDEEMGKSVYHNDYAQKGYTKQQHDRQVEVVQMLFKKKAESTNAGQPQKTL